MGETLVFNIRHKLSRRADSPGKREPETMETIKEVLPKMLIHLSQELTKYKGSGIDPYPSEEIKEKVMDAEALLYEIIMHYKYL